MTVGGPVNAQYNIMNLPTKLTTDAGTRYFGYVYGGGKYSARLESTPPNPDLDEVRHYLGGIEFVDGKPESYNFGDGRIVYEEGLLPRPQFRLHSLSRPQPGITSATRWCSLKTKTRMAASPPKQTPLPRKN